MALLETLLRGLLGGQGFPSPAPEPLAASLGLSTLTSSQRQAGPEARQAPPLENPPTLGSEKTPRVRKDLRQKGTGGPSGGQEG